MSAAHVAALVAVSIYGGTSLWAAQRIFRTATFRETEQAIQNVIDSPFILIAFMAAFCMWLTRRGTVLFMWTGWALTNGLLWPLLLYRGGGKLPNPNHDHRKD